MGIVAAGNVGPMMGHGIEREAWKSKPMSPIRNLRESLSADSEELSTSGPHILPVTVDDGVELMPILLAGGLTGSLARWGLAG